MDVIRLEENRLWSGALYLWGKETEKVPLQSWLKIPLGCSNVGSQLIIKKYLLMPYSAWPYYMTSKPLTVTFPYVTSELYISRYSR